jgi:hypothetical protein
MKALHNAWSVARAHGHHWAVNVTPARLVWGRAVRDTGRPPVGADEESLWPEPGTGDVPPATHEEAEALGYLPTGPVAGIRVPAPVHGAYASKTGTGRLAWHCYADGIVTLVVSRPADEGRIRVELRPGRDALVDCVGELGARHVESISVALIALLGDSPECERILRRIALAISDEAARAWVEWHDTLLCEQDCHVGESALTRALHARAAYQRTWVMRGESLDSYLARAESQRGAYLLEE